MALSWLLRLVHHRWTVSQSFYWNKRAFFHIPAALLFCCSNALSTEFTPPRFSCPWVSPFDPVDISPSLTCPLKVKQPLLVKDWWENKCGCLKKHHKLLLLGSIIGSYPTSEKPVRNHIGLQIKRHLLIGWLTYTDKGGILGVYCNSSLGVSICKYHRLCTVSRCVYVKTKQVF